MELPCGRRQALTGDLTLQLRAELSRTYTVTLESADTAGNKTQTDIVIPVGRLQR